MFFAQSIKVLSLFFIDEVVKYRDYSQAHERSEYVRIFDEEYEQIMAEYMSQLSFDGVVTIDTPPEYAWIHDCWPSLIKPDQREISYP